MAKVHEDSDSSTPVPLLIRQDGENWYMNGEKVHGHEGLSMIVYAKDAKNGVGVRLLVNQGQILPVGNLNFKDGVIVLAKRICPKTNCHPHTCRLES